MSEAALIEDHGITYSPEEVEEETSEIQETESAPVETMTKRHGAMFTLYRLIYVLTIIN